MIAYTFSYESHALSRIIPA